MKVLICWSHISGYMAACWRALAANVPDAKIHTKIIAFKTDFPGAAAAFKEDVVAGLNIRLLEPHEQTDANLILSIALEFKPDIVVIPGWFHQSYLALTKAKELQHARFVMTMDTPRRDTLRQKLGRYKIARLVRRLSAVVVPGERAWQLAKLLNVPESKIRRGLYGVDFEKLSPLHAQRASQASGSPRKFLFIGRYVEEKGVQILIEAYRRYSAMQRQGESWPLTCCGTGPLSQLLKNVPGVTDLGFVQPADAQKVFVEHGVFVLASRYDPWPLVIVEACAAGLPVVHSEACGSAVELVRPYFNGLGVATDSVESLANAMRWCEDHASELPVMGARSQPLAEAYSAQNWARRWGEMFAELAGEGTTNGG